MSFDTILFSGGRIGYQVEVSVAELKKAFPFQLGEITD